MTTETTTERQERAGRNESLFRALNESLKDVAPDDSTLHVFICECADPDCSKTISMTRSEYEAVRTVATRFAVRPDHHSAEVERIVSETDGRYAVVEKIEKAAEAATDTDPRRGEHPS